MAPIRRPTMGLSTGIATVTTTGMDTVTDTDQVAGGAGLALLRLLQLASPALPIGAFAYSQGREAAVEARLVVDEASAFAWIGGLMTGPVARLDLPLFLRLHTAFAAGQVPDAGRWNAYLLASRATAEMQAEDLHLGAALGRVLATLGIREPEGSTSTAAGSPMPGHTFARQFALATTAWGIAARPSAEAFAFTWAEAQTSAAVRLVPLGQSAGVRILASVAATIPAAVQGALAVADDEIAGAAPLQALLSTAHETQYSRLFRS